MRNNALGEMNKFEKKRKGIENYLKKKKKMKSNKNVSISFPFSTS